MDANKNETSPQMAPKLTEPGLIQVQTRSAYGTVRIYPVNATALLFAEFTGRKTFTAKEVELMAKLGFKIEWVPNFAGL